MRQLVALCLPLMIIQPLLAAEVPNTFQPGQVISANQINENFLALAALQDNSSLISAGMGTIEFFTESESTLGLSCEGQIITRSISDLLFIPSVCEGDCGIQRITESCGDYNFFGEGNISISPWRENLVPPRLGVKTPQNFSNLSILCQRISETEENCSPENSAWKIVEPIHERNQFSITLRQRVKQEINLGILPNDPLVYPISFEYEIVQFNSSNSGLTYIINGKEVLFSKNPSRSIVSSRSYGSSCGKTTSNGVILDDCRFSFYVLGTPSKIRDATLGQ